MKTGKVSLSRFDAAAMAITLRGLSTLLGRFADCLEQAECVDDAVTITAPISDLGLSVRARKTCMRLGVGRIIDLTKLSESDILNCRNSGLTTRNEIRDKMATLGLSLRADA